MDSHCRRASLETKLAAGSDSHSFAEVSGVQAMQQGAVTVLNRTTTTIRAAIQRWKSRVTPASATLRSCCIASNDSLRKSVG